MKQLRILFVEDSPEDAELEERDLRKGGLEFISKRVQTRDELAKALVEWKPDLVISDYSLPGMDGMGVLKTVREMNTEVPFIFVSGTIGEERAIESLKGGATDYVVKDRLGGFLSKVKRALREADDRDRRRKLEQELRQAQKMEAIGRLAGGVAHDFNNLLTVITGYARLALSRARPGDELSGDLEEVIRASEGAASLTRQLLTFSRRQVLAPMVLNLNQRVTEMTKMLKRIIGEDVELATRLEPSLGNIKADPGQVEQVIMNLAVNSRDAMPKGGTLTIETANVTLDEAEQRDRPDAPPGLHVLLTVRDTGTGMTPETKAHLFEPFFTTKEQGKGTGLGLSTVYGIVRQSGGSIEVISELDRGTSFLIRLPRVEEHVDESKGTKVARRAPAGSETVLVVEDSDSLRRLVHHVLQKQGYKVLLANDGESALKMSVEYEGPIHLLLTDVVMPRMGGPELANQLLQRRPDTRILYSSGYIEKAGLDIGAVGNRFAFLAKPFTPDELARRVREALEARPGE
jgi:two-component system, cell cycle sensor histidine kinase and response regulator CckA